jgi:hypothetical protein
MKKIVNLLKRLQTTPRTYHYHHEVMTDELERELMKAYAGTSGRGRRLRF